MGHPLKYLASWSEVRWPLGPRPPAGIESESSPVRTIPSDSAFGVPEFVLFYFTAAEAHCGFFVFLQLKENCFSGSEVKCCL